MGPGSGDTNTLDTRVISAKGHPASPATQVADWASINSYPQVIPFEDGRAIVFAGLRSDSSSDPYTSGTEYFFTSPDGSNWTLADDMMSDGKAAYGSYGSDSVQAAGNAVLVYTNGSTANVSYHEGYEPLMDPTSADPTTTLEANADVSETGDGYDAKSGQVWAVWDSLSGRKSTEGVSAQRLLPTLGARVHAPKTAVKSEGKYASSGVDQRIDVAPRSAAAGGGLYASYGVGYPFVKHVALWRLGGSKALVFKAGDDVYLTDVAPGPKGRRVGLLV